MPGLAKRLRARKRMVVTCLAFAFKNGVPGGAGWVVDARFLDNPYWVDELRPLDGRDPRVRDYVLCQASAVEAMDNLERTLRPLLPRLTENHWRKCRMAPMNDPSTIFDDDTAEKSYEFQDSSIHRGFRPVLAVWDRPR